MCVVVAVAHVLKASENYLVTQATTLMTIKCFHDFLTAGNSATVILHPNMKILKLSNPGTLHFLGRPIIKERFTATPC